MTRPNSTDRRTVLRAAGVLGATALAGCLGGGDDKNAADRFPEESAEFAVETVAEGLDQPWGMAFLPAESAVFVTELPGQLRLVDTEAGTVTEVPGAPSVYANGQGGLLDVTLHPDFPTEPWVYLTYSDDDGTGRSTTKLGRGRYDHETVQLTDFEELFVAEPFVDSDGHFGSRVVFDPQGLMYVSIGDRQFKDFGPDHVAQDLSNHLGCTVRLEPDGSIPPTNPFVDDPDARDELFTYGNRNPQGLTVHPETGAVWESEHGERDGDEINILEAGGNYGWPVADDGCKYGTDEPVGDDPEDRPDTIAPVYVWECGSGGFPPGGTTFYDGEAFPAWQGDLFVGNLAGQFLGRFSVEGRDVTAAGSLLGDRGWRIRDAAVESGTGHLYVAVDAEDAPIVRLVPE
jgi:glucose/arabinose dehydrogenase